MSLGKSLRASIRVRIKIVDNADPNGPTRWHEVDLNGDQADSARLALESEHWVAQSVFFQQFVPKDHHVVNVEFVKEIETP